MRRLVRHTPISTWWGKVYTQDCPEKESRDRRNAEQLLVNRSDEAVMRYRDGYNIITWIECDFPSFLFQSTTVLTFFRVQITLMIDW